MFWEILLPVLSIWVGFFVIIEVRASREETELKKRREAARAAAGRGART